MFLSDSETNLLNYSSETYDNLLHNIGARTVSDAHRDADARLLTDAAVYPVYYDSAVFALAKGVTGIHTAAEGGGVYFMNGRVLN
jgi:ABC-type oligopeptide transport system substrate-binding subunit